MTRIRVALAVALIAALAAGCSVSKEKQPRALAPNELPPELQTPTTVVATSLPTGKPQLPIYVFDPQAKRLHPLVVAVDSKTPDAVLQALVSNEQVKDPYTTDIPAGLTLGDTSTTKMGGCRTLRIPVSDVLSTLQGDQQRIAVAQLVYTATEFPDIDCVTFRIKGQSVDIPTGAKGGTAMVVSRKDYSDIAPKGTTS
jgi:spore germination protein GerM